MATIRKRSGPNGRAVYQAQVIRRGYKQQYRTFDTKAGAEAWSRRVESEMDRGDWQDRTEADRTTVSQALDRYLAEISVHKAPTTYQREINRVRQLHGLPFAQVALSHLGGKDVAAYVQKRARQGTGGNSLRRELALLSHLYTVAQTAWGMPYLTNPVPLARPALPAVPHGRERRLRGGLDGGEEAQLLAAAALEFRPVIRWALATCMRRAEIAGLTWDRVDFKRRTAFLPQTKNGQARSVPLSPEALDVLRSLPRRLDGSVFGVDPDEITRRMRGTCGKAGITGLTFHDLRHESISRLFEDTDLDVMEIRAISGHKTLQMLARYTHLRTARLADRLAGKSRI